MSVITDISAVVGATATSGGIAVAVGAWVRRLRLGRRESKAAIEHRNWHGYIELGGINTWPVRLMEHPKSPTAIVVLEVIDDEGAPDVHWAHNLRQWVQQDGMLARPPTAEEFELLKALARERGYGKGGHPIR